ARRRRPRGGGDRPPPASPHPEQRGGAKEGQGEETARQSDGDEDRRGGGEEEPSGGAKSGPRVVERAGDLDGVGLSPHLDGGGEDAHGLVTEVATRFQHLFSVAQPGQDFG